MHQDLVKKGYLGLKWPKSYLNRVFYRIVIAIYVPTYPPIFGIKIGKIVVTYPFPIVPLDKSFVVTLWTVSIPVGRPELFLFFSLSESLGEFGKDLFSLSLSLRPVEGNTRKLRS